MIRARLDKLFTVLLAGTLAGLVLYAAARPLDIRMIGPRRRPAGAQGRVGLVKRIVQAVQDYF